MKEYSTTEATSSSVSFALWVGVLAGPLAFLLQLQINYALVPWACTTGRTFVLHLVSCVALLMVSITAVIAWRIRGRIKREKRDESASSVSRPQFMAEMGLSTSILFLLIIIAQEIPNIVMHPCQP